MCGIIGKYKSSETVDVNNIYHRGVDNQQMIEFGDYTIGHTRLSIIDTENNANQPFHYLSSILTFNGEIYNYKELKDIYLSDYKFDTSSDTEVLSKMLYYHGIEKTLEVIDGMYSFFYYNPKDNISILVRDRFGKIPLFYQYQYQYQPDNKSFIWCSEQKGFKKHMLEFPKANYFDFSKSVFVEYYSYLNKNYKKFDLSILDNAVKKRLISDVPICTLISGGLDSSIILYLAKKYIPNIVAYTAVYDKNSNDYINAIKICKDLDVELRTVFIDPPTKKDIEDTIYCIESNMKAQIEISLLNIPLAKKIHEDGFKVVLSGEGADEIFGGYGNFAIKASKCETHEDWLKLKKDQIDKMSRGNFRRANLAFMKYSIECRLPFIDKDIVEFGLNAPKTENPIGKTILKEVSKGLIPDYIIKRKKETFQGASKMNTYIDSIYGNPTKMYNEIYKNIFKTI